MAEIVNETLAQLSENLTENANNGTAKPPSTPEGMAVAYGSLLIMAVLPIFFGAFRSVKHHKEKKASGEKPDTMSQKDAAMFPLIASAALFGLYLFFQWHHGGISNGAATSNVTDSNSSSVQYPSPWETSWRTTFMFIIESVAPNLLSNKIFSKEYINLLLTGYFFFLGILALTHLLSPVITRSIPDSFPNANYHLVFTKKHERTENDEPEGRDEDDIINYAFDHKDMICLISCTIIGLWYLWKKHWIANNLFGLAFAISGVELLHLNNIVTGCILLCGLFFYDIFWVFGTNVMVTVAKSFEAPIKLVFPQDLLERGLEANNFAMLGLGDIVIPGIFIALLLRFDDSLKRRHNTYFNVGFVAYILGLMGTIFVMHVFKHAQPALLYLVPACIGAPVLTALIKGDIKNMFQYEDHPSDEAESPKRRRSVSGRTTEPKKAN